MKIDALIEKLTLLKKRGTTEIFFTVKDYYSLYGSEANLLSEDSTPERFWEGTQTVDERTSIRLSLNTNYEGSYPKIIFRKK